MGGAFTGRSAALAVPAAMKADETAVRNSVFFTYDAPVCQISEWSTGARIATSMTPVYLSLVGCLCCGAEATADKIRNCGTASCSRFGNK